MLHLGMPNDRQDQRNTTNDHPRFDALWNDSGMHNGEICPPEPAHQRALNLLPMEGDDEQSGSMPCTSRDKKRGSQRIAAGKKACDDEEGLTQRGGADLPRSLDLASGAQLDGGREYAGSSPKKMRKKSKRIVHNKDDITIFPRRKAGQDKLGSNRPPIVISRTVLESYFNMPQQKVCEKLVSTFLSASSRAFAPCSAAASDVLNCAIELQPLIVN